MQRAKLLGAQGAKPFSHPDPLWAFCSYLIFFLLDLASLVFDNQVSGDLHLAKLDKH